jgi:hypothetical protein
MDRGDKPRDDIRGAGGVPMIPIASLQRIAEQLMAKAAIEIPDDYLEGLRRCADTDGGSMLRAGSRRQAPG